MCCALFIFLSFIVRCFFCYFWFVICYLLLVLFYLLFEGAKVQKMLTSVLSEGAKAWEWGVARCTCGVARFSRDVGWPKCSPKVPNGSKSAPKRNQMDPKWSQRDPKWSQGVPKGSQGDPNGSQMGAESEPKSSPKLTKKRSRCILGENGGIKVPKRQHIGITTRNLGLKIVKNRGKKWWENMLSNTCDFYAKMLENKCWFYV